MKQIVCLCLLTPRTWLILLGVLAKPHPCGGRESGTCMEVPSMQRLLQLAVEALPHTLYSQCWLSAHLALRKLFLSI